MAELATEEEDYAYYMREQYSESEKGPLPETFPGVEGELGMVGDASDGFKTIVAQRRRGEFEILWDRHESRMLSRSLCMYYRLTGHEPALELAGKIVRGVLKRWRGHEDDGRWLISHFHRGADSLLATLEYAAITGDTEVMKFVDRCYDYAKAVSDDLVGFFPEIVPGFDIRKMHHSTKIYPDCETCEGGYVNRCVNDIRRRPSQPLIQWRFHPHTVHRGRRLRSTQGPSDA